MGEIHEWGVGVVRRRICLRRFVCTELPTWTHEPDRGQAIPLSDTDASHAMVVRNGRRSRRGRDAGAEHLDERWDRCFLRIPTGQAPARAFVQARMSERAAVSICGGAVERPRDRRTAPSAVAASTPIARSTDEAASAPSWQAEPVEAATSGAPASTALPRTPGNETLRVFGRRSVA